MIRIMRRDHRHPVGPGTVHGRTRRRPFRTLRGALIIAALLASGSAAQAMEVSVIGNTMILSGPVVGDELPKVRNMFTQNPAINVAVLRNSWGGHAPTGYRIGELFRDRGILDAGFPRAFAVAPTRRHWAWNTGANDVSEALRRCGERAGQACTLYAVDETVVYRP